LIGELSAEEQNMPPVKSRRVQSPLVLIGDELNKKGKAVKGSPVLPIDALEVLRCLDISKEALLTADIEQEMSSQGGTFKSFHGQQLTDYNINLETIGMFVPLQSGRKGKEQIESKLASGVPHYQQAKKAARKFLWTFGTHYVDKVHMGGLMVAKTYFDKTDNVDAASASIEAKSKIDYICNPSDDDLNMTDPSAVGVAIAKELQAQGITKKLSVASAVKASAAAKLAGAKDAVADHVIKAAALEFKASSEEKSKA